MHLHCTSISRTNRTQLTALVRAPHARIPLLPGSQLKEAGLATHFIPSSQLHLIKAALAGAGPAASDLAHVHALLSGIEAAAAAAAPPHTPSLARLLPAISRCFGRRSVAGVVAALKAEDADPAWSAEALQQLQR